MGCEVYANGDEIACKAGAGKVISAFPDVCLSPPSPPAGPVPVPYPNTSFSADTQNGSKSVVIIGQEVMLKDQSFYKTSPLGDEAATNGLGASVVTHVITGKTYFNAWSMDVLFEGQNVDRHTDLTTSNHASPAGSTPPFPNVAFMAPPGDPKDGKCPCCGRRHAGQQGGVAVSEDHWYGLNEGADIDREQRRLQNHPPHSSDQKAVNAWKKNLSDLADRDVKLQKRKDVIHRARENNCPSLPEPPCNTYYVFPQTAGDSAAGVSTSRKQAKLIEGEWDASRKKFKAKRPLMYPPDTPQYAQKTNHRVPKAAGGCPNGKGNLKPDSRLSDECLQVDKELSEIQGDAASRWASSLK